MISIYQHKNEYRRSIDEYQSAKPVRRKIGLYWILAALRIALTFVPQTGYIHPDEFFQSIEVISGKLLLYCFSMLTS
jgi:phosphatidylinositol glycan class Z